MSVEVLPLGVACNLACTYCYQEPMRDSGNIKPPGKYDIPKMMEGVKETNADHFTIFGGEPLLCPLPDLEKMWEYGMTLSKKQNGIQTNGVLITNEHIKAFKKYNVHVGFSIDGPGKLNDTRWVRNLDETRKASRKSNRNIIKCFENKVGASLITTLSNVNANEESLPKLIDWFRMLYSKGLRHVNLHFLEVDSVRAAELRLSTKQLVKAAIEISKLMGELKGFTVTPLKTMVELLLGDDRYADCIWHACDPYTTAAVQGILGDGQKSNCGRAYKDGIDWEKADKVSHVRQLVLWNTPYEHGGCKDCRFFYACKGNCPGTGIDGDWRHRTEHCESLIAIFEYFESMLKSMGMKPVSDNESAWRSITEQLIIAYQEGKSPSLYGIKNQTCSAPISRPHGDHFDSNRVVQNQSQQEENRPHGDIPHGDHTDDGNPIASDPTYPHGDNFNEELNCHGDSHGNHYDGD